MKKRHSFPNRKILSSSLQMFITSFYLKENTKYFKWRTLKKIKLNFFEVVHKSPSVISVSPPHSFVSFAGHCNPKLLAYNERRRRHLTCHLKEVTEQMGCSHSCFTRYRNDGLMTSPQQHKESTKRVLAEHTLNFWVSQEYVFSQMIFSNRWRPFSC